MCMALADCWIQVCVGVRKGVVFPQGHCREQGWLVGVRERLHGAGSPKVRSGDTQIENGCAATDGELTAVGVNRAMKSARSVGKDLDRRVADSERPWLGIEDRRRRAGRADQCP